MLGIIEEIMNEYLLLQKTMAILRNAREECFKEYGGAFHNPAWDKVNHAMNYIERQMKDLLAE